MKLHTSTGTLKCLLEPSAHLYRMYVVVDPGIVDFYRSLVPKHIKLNRQRYAPHITVVKESHIPNMAAYHALDGLKVEFEYDYYTYHDETYWWLPAVCDELSLARVTMGLSPMSAYTKPPDGSDIYHITIGNTKAV